MLLSVECLRGRLGCVFYNRLLIFVFCEKDTGGGLAGGETRHRRASSGKRARHSVLCAVCRHTPPHKMLERRSHKSRKSHGQPNTTNARQVVPSQGRAAASYACTPTSRPTHTKSQGAPCKQWATSATARTAAEAQRALDRIAEPQQGCRRRIKQRCGRWRGRASTLHHRPRTMLPRWTR